MAKIEFGICANLDQAAAARSQGWNYLEASAQGVFDGRQDDAKWHPPAKLAQAALPIRAVNMLVPASLKITGPQANLDGQLRPYLQRVILRAAQAGVKILVFGSGGARAIPDGFDRATALAQIVAFAQLAAELAADHDCTIVVEPLNRSECNVINSIAEAMEIVRRVNRPSLRCLLDSYHFWMEQEPIKNLEDAIDSIAHVHVADLEGRVAPGRSGSSDYRELFAILKRHGYAGRISVEASNFEIAADGARALAFLKSRWEA